MPSTGTLTLDRDPTGIVNVGDAVVVRNKASGLSSTPASVTQITDPGYQNVANSYGGLAVSAEIGNLDLRDRGHRTRPNAKHDHGEHIDAVDLPAAVAHGRHVDMDRRSTRLVFPSRFDQHRQREPANAGQPLGANCKLHRPANADCRFHGRRERQRITGWRPAFPRRLDLRRSRRAIKRDGDLDSRARSRLEAISAQRLFYTSSVSLQNGVTCMVKQAPIGADLVIQVYAGTTLLFTVTIAANSTVGSTTGTPAIGPETPVIINLTAVGTTFPGSDLTVALS